MSSFAPQQSNLFQFPQPGSEFSTFMCNPLQNACLFSPPKSPPFQLCELVYTQMPNLGCVTLTPSLVPINSMDGQVYGDPAVNTAPSQANFMHAMVKRDKNEENDVNKVSFLLG